MKKNKDLYRRSAFSTLVGQNGKRLLADSSMYGFDSFYHRARAACKGKGKPTPPSEKKRKNRKKQKNTRK